MLPSPQELLPTLLLATLALGGLSLAMAVAGDLTQLLASGAPAAPALATAAVALLLR